MALRIDHELEIAASPAIVWEVLTDFAAYGEWNPFVVGADSTLEVGAAMDMRVRVLPFITQSQREWVTRVEPGKCFCYGLPPGGTGALRSERCHVLTPLGTAGCRYVSRFAIEGWLSGLVGGLLGRQLRRGFGDMSAAVKSRAESRATA